MSLTPHDTTPVPSSTGAAPGESDSAPTTEVPVAPTTQVMPTAPQAEATTVLPLGDPAYGTAPTQPSNAPSNAPSTEATFGAAPAASPYAATPGAAFTVPVPQPGSGEPGTPTPTKTKERGRFGQTAAAALLAAVLASGGTYALTSGNTTGTATPPATTPTATTNEQGTSPTIPQADTAAPNWTAVAAAVSPSVVSISVETQTGGGAGSGVVYDKAGHILTNNHVVDGAGQGGSISVTLSDGLTYGAKVVGTDPSTDLAIIKLDSVPDNLVPISIGDSSALKVGDPVMAVGNPLGLSGTVTTGIVSALNRPVTTQSSEGNNPFGQQQGSADPVVTNAIQTSAAINPGNSGGALVNAEGQLIGINSSIASLSNSGGSQSGNIGIGFAIPINEAKNIAGQLISKGSAEHAFLGVSARDTVVQDGSAKRAGAQVVSVSSGTPADSAGLKQGDVIIAVDGRAIDGSTALVAQVRERSSGDKVTVTLIRDGKKQDVSVTLATRPTTAAP